MDIFSETPSGSTYPVSPSSSEPLFDCPNPPDYKELQDDSKVDLSPHSKILHNPTQEHDHEKDLLTRIKSTLGLNQDSDVNFFVNAPENIPASKAEHSQLPGPS